MKLLDKLIKWFFNTTKIEVNTDWRLVALDEHRDNIELRNRMKELIQENTDLKQINKILREKSE